MEIKHEVVNHTQAQVTNITSTEVSLWFSRHHDDPMVQSHDIGHRLGRSLDVSVAVYRSICKIRWLKYLKIIKILYKLLKIYI